MENERDEYQCPSCGEMKDVEKMCNADGACDDCQESETYPCPQCQGGGCPYCSGYGTIPK